MLISNVKYALESPWPCDGLGLGPSSWRRCLLSFLCVVKTLQNPTKPYLKSKISRVNGRVIGNPLVSVTIDLLMKCSPRFIASGSDRENGVVGKAGDHSLSANDESAGTDLLFDAIFLNRRRWL